MISTLLNNVSKKKNFGELLRSAAAMGVSEVVVVGDVEVDKALKVKIRHSSAMLEALLSDRIAWRVDPDFGYLVVDVHDPQNAPLLDLVPAEILDPSLLYRRTGRTTDYTQWVLNMKRERRAFLEGYAVDVAIVDAVCGDGPVRTPEIPENRIRLTAK